MALDDTEIMERVQRGEHSLFDELVARYQPTLLRVASSKLGESSLTEDVVQEAFLAAFSARHTYNSDFAFRTWIWTILLNLCRRHVGRRKRNREFSQSVLRASRATDVPEPASSENGLQHVLHAESRELLSLELDRLPEGQADAIRLRFFGGLKFQEIADAMQCSLRAAKQRVKNGLILLSQRLDSTG